MAPRLILLAAGLLLAAGPAGAQGGGKQAWTHARTSTGLHSLEQSARVLYQAAPGSIPAGAEITQVHAQRDYAGQADVHTSLCWKGIERCVDVTGRTLNTHAFDGLDANQPMYLVHRVTAWHGSRPPVHIKGNVTVWYAMPAAAGARDADTASVTAPR